MNDVSMWDVYPAIRPSTLLSLSYNYVQTGGGNNGSVVSITNGRDSSRSVSYTYDQVNRLSSAQTSSTWGNSYGYGAITCKWTGLPRAETIDVTITVKVNAASGTNLVNLFNIKAQTQDLNQSNNSVSFTTHVQ